MSLAPSATFVTLCLLPLHLCDDAVQVISPFVDPVTRSKAEFVTTADYDPKASKASSTSTWSSWFSSSKQQQQPAAGSDNGDADIDVIVDDQQKQAKGPGTFGPLLSFYKTPFCFERHQTLLRSAGVV